MIWTLSSPVRLFTSILFGFLQRCRFCLGRPSWKWNCICILLTPWSQNRNIRQWAYWTVCFISCIINMGEWTPYIVSLKINEKSKKMLSMLLQKPDNKLTGMKAPVSATKPGCSFSHCSKSFLLGASSPASRVPSLRLMTGTLLSVSWGPWLELWLYCSAGFVTMPTWPIPPHPWGIWNT